jgi:dihydrolipoamide dehydrogenase
VSETAPRHAPLLVLGGGPAGYPAAFRAADLGMKVTLVDADPKLGGVCVQRGCIPSKALLHVAKLIDEARGAEHMGLSFAPPAVDLDKLRQFVQQGVVGKMTGGLDLLTKARGVERIRARGVFESSNTVRLEGETAGTITFDTCIVAVGSVPAMPRAFAGGDPRVMDSTGALALPDVPKRLLVIGGGYIGLEMGSVYAALGSKVVVVEFLDGILLGADRDLVKPLEERLRKKFEAILLSTKVASLSAEPAGVAAVLEGADGSKTKEMFDRVLVSVGRRPNSAGIGLEKTKVALDEKGFIKVDSRGRTSDPNILAVGDAAGEPMLAHKGTHQAIAAVEALAGEPSEFSPRCIPAVVFTDPEIAWCGITEKEAKDKGTAVEVHKWPWAASGRATTLARNDGMTKLIVEPETKRILGVGIVGVGAGDLISEGALAIEMAAVARDLAETIHPHPTLSETLMEAAEVALGHPIHLFKPKRTPRA